MKDANAVDPTNAPSSSTQMRAKVWSSRRRFTIKHDNILIGGVLLAVQKSQMNLEEASTIVKTAVNPRREMMLQKAKSICNNSPGLR
jgi:hypothetical protein